MPGGGDGLTMPASPSPVAMSTICTAISLPQRLCASRVLAPRCGQQMTLGWFTRSQSFGGSCRHSPAPPSAPGTHLGALSPRKEGCWGGLSPAPWHVPGAAEPKPSPGGSRGPVHLREDVEGGPATLSRSQRPQQRALVHDAASGAVDHLHAAAALGEGAVVQEPCGAREGAL